MILFIYLNLRAAVPLWDFVAERLLIVLPISLGENIN